MSRRLQNDLIARGHRRLDSGKNERVNFNWLSLLPRRLMWEIALCAFSSSDWHSTYNRTPGRALRRASGMGSPHSSQWGNPSPAGSRLLASDTASSTLASTCAELLRHVRKGAFTIMLGPNTPFAPCFAVKVKGAKVNALKRCAIPSGYMRLCGQGGAKSRLNSQKPTFISISYQFVFQFFESRLRHHLI